MDVPDDLRITITDVQAAGHCPSGARRWFEAHDIDFRKFLKEGVPAEVMLATGDAQGIHVIEMKMRREVGDIPPDLVITIDDVRESIHCAAGVRAWAAERRLDYNNFLERGITADELLATGDPKAIGFIRDKMSRIRG
jgi:hypothetical protein